MAKKGKKRKQTSATPLLHTSSAQEESIESCLADLEQVTNPLYVQEHPKADEEKDDAVVGKSFLSSFPFVKSSMTERKERLRNWNAAFSQWNASAHGHYTPGLLPSFEVELARHFQLQKLSKFLLEKAKDLKMPAFERWLLDSKLEERQQQQSSSASYNDPILVQTPSLKADSSQRLLEELCETGLPKDEALSIVKELLQRTTTACQEIYNQQLRCASQTPFKHDKIEIEFGSHLVSLLYSKKKWKSPFIIKINTTHYQKLKQRFLDMHHKVIRTSDLESTKVHNKAQYCLHVLIMVITLRYSSLSGGQLLEDFRGGGMQGAINEKGFDVLKEFFPRVFECFGSPLNATLPCFASAFETLDWHFGSMGDLAQCPEFKDGCCGEANPPFTPGFMEFLAHWILQRIAHANDHQKSLSFVVIVPSVHEKDVTVQKGKRVASAVKRFAAKAHQQMVDSPACSQFIVLPAKEHGYVEGAQHLRPTRYKKSLYDTSVILLQSQTAKATESFDKDKFEQEIRTAFAERHSEESRKRAKTTK